MASSEFAGARVAEDVPLAPLTTLRVGPVARRVITCASTEQVVAALGELDSGPAPPPLVLAGGSNVLIADDLTGLTVLRLANTAIEIDGDTLRVEAGAVWDDVVVAAIDAGLGGLECLSGIPGSAGATPVQNVGAYGAEVADTITRVLLLDRQTGAVRWTASADLRFGYRTSVLKHSGDTRVVLQVEFALDTSGRSAPLRYRELTDAVGSADGDRAEPAAVRAAVLALRARKGMVLDPADHDTWSAGSFFTNPVVADDVHRRLTRQHGEVPHWPVPGGVKLAAGWLVEHAGFGKGYPGADGAPARLSTKHALAVTNRGGARTADLLALARLVRDGVQAAFGITLEPEPVLIGCTL